jgi:hypothetical protein
MRQTARPVAVLTPAWRLGEVGYWLCQDAPAAATPWPRAILADASGNGRTGTVYSVSYAATYPTDDDPPFFDGADDYAVFAALPDPGSFLVAWIWFRIHTALPAAYQVAGVFRATGATAGRQSWRMRVNGTSFVVGITDAAGTTRELTVTGVVPAPGGTDLFVCAVYNAATLKAHHSFTGSLVTASRAAAWGAMYYASAQPYVLAGGSDLIANAPAPISVFRSGIVYPPAEQQAAWVDGTHAATLYALGSGH